MPRTQEDQMPEVIAIVLVELPPPDSLESAALEARWRALLAIMPRTEREELEDMAG